MLFSGVMEWLVLRSYLPLSGRWWILTSVVSWAIFPAATYALSSLLWTPDVVFQSGLTEIEMFAASYPSDPAAPEAPEALIELRSELADARHRFCDARDQLVVFTELLLCSLRDPAIAQIFQKLDQSWHGYFVDLIERGILQEVFRADLDPAVIATLVMLQIKGFGYQRLWETNPALADAVFDQLVLQVESWLTVKSKN
jgi:BetI-type transcriptional repressor, C-terminal